MAVPGFGEQLVHGLACFIDHNICVSKRTEYFYTITTIIFIIKEVKKIKDQYI